MFDETMGLENFLDYLNMSTRKSESSEGSLQHEMEESIMNKSGVKLETNAPKELKEDKVEVTEEDKEAMAQQAEEV
jgi:hypothetical protein